MRQTPNGLDKSERRIPPQIEMLNPRNVKGKTVDMIHQHQLDLVGAALRTNPNGSKYLDLYVRGTASHVVNQSRGDLLGRDHISGFSAEGNPQHETHLFEKL